ncbi:histidine kinase [Sphingomonas oleivorans]|uniref:Histidine kinase n=1 Tax=Sphingomonas oleivorans TaxID=1735121 RepID=A0A2T5FWQ1_9SPHN|nr:histidine kinase [Sphingomonas oleivorans]PTQ10209.1 histidine kinase [Sphingomonas oleivorans]
MLRFLTGVASALLLVAGGVLWWKSGADAENPIPAMPQAAATGPVALAPVSDPPQASVKTREEKRFARYDKDRNGAVAREEYLASRHKAFTKLDANGDGRLSFEEWAIKTSTKFAGADKDGSGALTPTEFATTRVIRKTSARLDCPPAKVEED